MQMAVSGALVPTPTQGCPPVDRWSPEGQRPVHLAGPLCLVSNKRQKYSGNTVLLGSSQGIFHLSQQARMPPLSLF